MTEPLFYTKINAQQKELYLVASQKGVAYISAFDYPFEKIADQFSNYQLLENQKLLAPYEKQLQEYLSGDRQIFEMPVDFLDRGTIFQREVWQALTEIPYGQTIAYSQIAERIKRPKAVRAVGGAVGKNPLSIVIPCHRVIGKDGSLTGYTGGMPMKKYLLTLENIPY